MKIRITNNPVHHVDSADLEKAVIVFLKQRGVEMHKQPSYDPKIPVGWDKWSFQADQDCGNDSILFFTVYSEEPEEKNKEKLGKSTYCCREILNWMCAEKEIPEGEYIVSHG